MFLQNKNNVHHIQLIMISIGVPEKGKQLIEHLQLEEFTNILFVDPENILYDKLELNRGVQRTFMNVNTPFSFVKRFQKKDGMKDLLSVLSNWKDVAFIPPKQEQAFLQGGTFIFDDTDTTVYAHYDPSTAAHASIERVMEVVTMNVMNKNNNNNKEEE